MMMMSTDIMIEMSREEELEGRQKKNLSTKIMMQDKIPQRVRARSLFLMKGPLSFGDLEQQKQAMKNLIQKKKQIFLPNQLKKS